MSYGSSTGMSYYSYGSASATTGMTAQEQCIISSPQTHQMDPHIGRIITVQPEEYANHPIEAVKHDPLIGRIIMTSMEPQHEKKKRRKKRNPKKMPSKNPNFRKASQTKNKDVPVSQSLSGRSILHHWLIGHMSKLIPFQIKTIKEHSQSTCSVMAGSNNNRFATPNRCQSSPL